MTETYDPRARIPSRQVANVTTSPLQPAPKENGPLPAGYHRVGTPKIAEAIAAIQREIGIVNKGGENTFHHYKYARIEDILEALTPLLGQHGLGILQSEIDVQQIENRVAVRYEFSIIHTSGEIQGPFFKYGMSNARDSKGNWDDKCINKAHTQARRYFLVGLFNIPTAELDDNERNDRRQQRDTTRQPAQQRVPPRESQGGKGNTHIPPQKIGLGAGKGAKAWAERFIQMIGQAVSKAEIMEWDKLNTDALKSLAEGFDDVYERVCGAIEMRVKALGPAPADAATVDAAMAAAENVAAHMPSPKADAIAACNWVAQQLNDLKTPAAVEAFWRQVIEPRQKDFLPPDYEVLLGELRRAEERVGTRASESEEER